MLPKAPRCKVCQSPRRKQIEQAMILGSTYASINKEYGISYPTLREHKENHLPQQVAEDMRSRMIEFHPPADDFKPNSPQITELLDCLSYLHTETLWIYKKAKEEQDYNLALKAIKQDLECISTVFKGQELVLAHDAQDDWEKLLPKILKAVEPYKEAKKAIAEALYHEAEEYNKFKNRELAIT